MAAPPMEHFNMKIVEQKVSAGNCDIFELAEFLSRPLYAHLAHNSDEGPRESPVWFYWDGEVIWIIGGASFPENLKRDPRCALGIVDWDPTTGLSHHVGMRGRAEVLPFDPAKARSVFQRYLGPDEADWDPALRLLGYRRSSRPDDGPVHARNGRRPRPVLQTYAVGTRSGVAKAATDLTNGHRLESRIRHRSPHLQTARKICSDPAARQTATD
jgi:hypothetical protein